LIGAVLSSCVVVYADADPGASRAADAATHPSKTIFLIYPSPFRSATVERLYPVPNPRVWELGHTRLTVSILALNTVGTSGSGTQCAGFAFATGGYNQIHTSG